MLLKKRYFFKFCTTTTKRYFTDETVNFVDDWQPLNIEGGRQPKPRPNLKFVATSVFFADNEKSTAVNLNLPFPTSNCESSKFSTKTTLDYFMSKIIDQMYTEHTLPNIFFRIKGIRKNKLFFENITHLETFKIDTKNVVWDNELTKVESNLFNKLSKKQFIFNIVLYFVSNISPYWFQIKTTKKFAAHKSRLLNLTAGDRHTSLSTFWLLHAYYLLTSLYDILPVYGFFNVLKPYLSIFPFTKSLHGLVTARDNTTNIILLRHFILNLVTPEFVLKNYPIFNLYKSEIEKFMEHKCPLDVTISGQYYYNFLINYIYKHIMYNASTSETQYLYKKFLKLPINFAVQRSNSIFSVSQLKLHNLLVKTIVTSFIVLPLSIQGDNIRYALSAEKWETGAGFVNKPKLKFPKWVSDGTVDPLKSIQTLSSMRVPIVKSKALRHSLVERANNETNQYWMVLKRKKIRSFSHEYSKRVKW